MRASRRGRGREQDPRVKKLCRFLGFGLLCVSARGKVEVLVEPVPWRPRRDGKRRSRIVEEHRRRHGDPVAGGSTRQPLMTTYRQRAALEARSAETPGGGLLAEMRDSEEQGYRGGRYRCPSTPERQRLGDIVAQDKCWSHERDGKATTGRTGVLLTADYLQCDEQFGA